MPLEHEIKIRIHSAEEITAHCRELGARLIQDRQFEDNQVLDFADMRLKNEGKLLRLRIYGQEKLLTFKGPADVQTSVKTREEIEVHIESLPAWDSIFKNLGLRPVFRYQKYRTIYEILEQQLGTAVQTGLATGRSLQIMVDETPIGEFIELEGDSDLIIHGAELLGYGPEAFILGTYRDLYVECCLQRGSRVRDMVFDDTSSLSS